MRRSGRESGRWWVDWGIPFACFAVVLGAWSVASPLGSSADEPTTIVRAAAIVRGQLTGSAPPPGISNANVRLDVTVPETFAHTTHDCYLERPKVSAQCSMPPNTTARTATVQNTLVGRYPPLYYLVAGLPSYLPGGVFAVVFMRFAGDLLNAAFLALAVTTVRRYARNRVTILGLAFAVSPMVLYFGSVVNPSGLELATSISLWVAAALWSDLRTPAPPGLVWTTAVSAAVVVQSRPASLAWPIVVAVTVAPLSAVAVSSYLRAPDARRRAVAAARSRLTALAAPGALAIASAAVAAAWFVTEHPLIAVPGGLPAPGTSTSTLVHRSISLLPGYLAQGVGRLGWLDVPLPFHILYLWYAGVGALLVGALALGTLRQRVALVISVVWSATVPVVGTLASVHVRGFSSQGRYFLPIFVGMPIVASVVLGRVLSERRAPRPVAALGALVSVIVVAVVGTAQGAVFAWTLRRYLVGIDGPVLPWVSRPGAWHPPLPATLLDVAVALALAVLAVHLAGARTSRRLPHRSLHSAGGRTRVPLER